MLTLAAAQQLSGTSLRFRPGDAAAAAAGTRSWDRPAPQPSAAPLGVKQKRSNRRGDTQVS